MSEVDNESIERMVNKLLDKAGKDPRLTPRLLREKTEQRLDLKKDELKSKRTLIKELICSWWKKNANDIICSDSGIRKISTNTDKRSSGGGGSSDANNNNTSSNSNDNLEREQFKAVNTSYIIHIHKRCIC